MQTSYSSSPRPLTLAEIRTLALASLGGALEFYDFVIFVFFTAVIGKLFFSASLPEWMREIQTFGIFAAGYLARPLGGVVMAHFGDIYGRKRMFTSSILLMAIPTLLIGCLPTYHAAGVIAPLLLLAMRLLQGGANGGEAPGGWVFVAEHARPQRVGFAIGLLTGGLSLGILLGSLVAVVLNVKFSQAQIANGVWRIPFVLGGIFGFIAMFLRRWLNETPVFEEMRQRAALSRELPLRAVLKSHRRAVATSVISTWMLTAAIVVVILMTPLLLQKLFGLGPREIQMANLVGTAALCLSTIAIGAATDQFGIRCTSVPILLLMIAATYGLYFGAEHTLRTTSALRARRIRRRRSSADSHSYDSRVSAAGALYGCLILLQHCLRGLRRVDSVNRFGARSRQPVQPRTLHRGCNNARSCGYIYDPDSTPSDRRER